MTGQIEIGGYPDFGRRSPFLSPSVSLYGRNTCFGSQCHILCVHSHTLAISRQAKTTFFFIVFRSNLCVTRSVYGWMMSLIPLSSRGKYINNIITVIIFCAFLKPHLHCFANRSFLVTGSIGCISLASGCGVMTLTGTCVPLPVLFPQIKKREIL